MLAVMKDLGEPMFSMVLPVKTHLTGIIYKQHTKTQYLHR